MIKFIKQLLFSLITSLCVVAQVNFAVAQTAALLPIAPQQFFNNNGNPLASGKVYYYIPNTLTFKSVWADTNETIPLTNPVVLDAAGRPNGALSIYGQGSYRQIIRDASGNLIADTLTSSTGGGGSGGGATGDGDLVGTIKPWAGLIAPNQYAFAYGQELSRTTYNALYTAITQAMLVTCTSGSSILTNVTDTTQISVGSDIELSCVAPGTTVLSKTAITVTLSANSSLSTNVSGTFFPFGNGNGSTTFNLPDLRGLTIAGRNNMGGIASSKLTTAFYGTNPDALGAIGGNQSHTLLTAELAAHTHPSSILTDPTHTHGINDPSHAHTGDVTGGSGLSGAGTIQSGTGSGVVDLGISVSASFTGITAVAAGTGITLSANTGSQGSGTAFSIVQPSATLNYIIKILPDAASSVSTGVTSIASMVGDIACGVGLLCTGNVISATGGGGGGAGTPTDPITSVQFNAGGGLFGGSANLTWVSPKLSIGASGTTGELAINGSGSGSVIQTVQAAAGTPTITWGTSTGTPVVTASAPLAITAATGNIVVTGAAGQVLAGATPAFTSTPTLGASGTLGSLTFGNATSGLLTLAPVTGALGTVTVSLPAATDTLVGKATTDVFTNKTYDTAATGNSFLINGLAATANTGTGSVVRATSPTLVTPTLGVATATTINKVTLTPPATGSTITIADGKTFTASNTISFTGTDGTSFAFPLTSDTIVSLNAIQTLTNKTLTSPSINGGTAIGLTNFGIRSSGSGAFDLTLNNTENLTAGRTITLAVNNASRVLNISGNITTAADFITAGSNSLTLTTTGPTNITFPTTGTLVNSAVTTLSNLSTIGTITSGTWNSTVIGLLYGGTGQTSAATARSCSGLNIDCITTFGNANYIVLNTDRTVATTNSFSSPRVVTLPAVSTFNSGQQLTIVDSVGAINGANTLTITAAGGDSINGLASVILSTQYSGAVLWPVGSNRWGYIASASGAGSGTVTNITAGAGLSTGTGSSAITTSGTLYAINAPQGRLTLVTGVPVMVSNQTAKSTIYYTCYNGNVVPYYNGTSNISDTIASCEVSLTMVSAASAGQVVSGQVYDIWWINGGTNRICIAMSASGGGGGGWASDTSGSNTARGTGYSQIHNTRGFWTNTNSITNCFNGATNYGPVSADQGTYLGTIYATANGQTGMNFNPSPAAGGTANILGLFNAYNQKPIIAICQDSTATWTMASTTWRKINNNANNSISFVDGLQQSIIEASYQVGSTSINANGSGPLVGLSLDWTTGGPTFQLFGIYGDGGGNRGIGSDTIKGHFLPVLGFHVINALEASSDTNTQVFGPATSTGSTTSEAILVKIWM